MSQWDWSVYVQEWTCCVMTGCRINPPDRHLIRFVAVAKWNQGNVWRSINPCIGSHCVVFWWFFSVTSVTIYCSQLGSSRKWNDHKDLLKTKVKIRVHSVFYKYTLDSAGNIFDSASCLLYFQLSEHPILSVIKDQINHFTIRLPDNDEPSSRLLFLFFSSSFSCSSLSSKSFVQYIHYLSSTHVQTTLASLTLAPNCSTWAVPLMYSFLIWWKS